MKSPNQCKLLETGPQHYHHARQPRMDTHTMISITPAEQFSPNASCEDDDLGDEIELDITMYEQHPQATANLFFAWVKTQPKDRSYDFLNNRDCAFALFLKETGVCSSPNVGGYNWRDTEGRDYGLDESVFAVLGGKGGTESLPTSMGEILTLWEKLS